MRSSTSGPLRYERASAFVLLVFAGGAILDALLRIALLAGTDVNRLADLMLAAVPSLISLGVWTGLRGHRELVRTCLAMLLAAIAIGWVSLGSALPISWYLGVGIVIWSMRLGQNLLMWVGTSLVVLAAGAQFNLIDYGGALYLPFVITVPVFLGAAAYFQFNQVRAQAQELDLDAAESEELHLKRYGKLPND